jgi:predicted permease
MIGGRLKPGVSMRQAAAEIDVLGRALYKSSPRLLARNGTLTATEPRAGLRLAGASPIPGNLRLVVAGFLAILMVLVSVVLIIACANLAGVLLARGTARRREIAVRLAIGAGRGRLVRQLLTETLLLFVLGGAAGLWLARGMTSLVVSLLPAFPVPVNLSFPLEGRVVAFTTGVSLLAAALCGLIPALQASKADVVSALKDEEQGPSGRTRLRNAFVVAQVAFSIMLVVAAGLLGRALGKVTASYRGFDPRGIELASIDLSMGAYDEATGRLFARDLVTRVRELPGVQTATLADRAPIPGVRFGMFGDGLSVPGVAPPDGQPLFPVSWSFVEPGYFETLRIPLVAGRDFSAADRAGEQPVVIVPEATARQLWPGQNAVGKYVLWQRSRPGLPSSQTTPPTSLLVIGVAKNLKGRGPAGQMLPLAVYAPLQQRYVPRLTIIARTTHGQRITNEIRGLLQSMDRHLPILTSRTLEEELIGPVEMQLRVSAAVSGSVGLIGMLLATIGIYGVTAYAVARRTREIGIRMAMGADRTDVMSMVLRQGMTLVGIGSALGLMLAAGASRLLTRLLFGIPPLDPLTYGGAAVLFATIGLAACYLPARRATRIDPLVALRYE